MSEERKPQWVRFGVELRRAREIAGITQAQLADMTGWARSTISALQTGTRVPQRDQVESLDGVLATGGTLTRLWVTLKNNSEVPNSFRDILAMEREASFIREYHPTLVPGILQTEAYARAVISSGRPWLPDSAVDKLVSSRIARHEVLAGTDRPIAWFVVDDLVLQRQIGSPETARQQLEYMCTLAQQAIRLQVLPGMTKATPGLSGPFRLMSFSEERPMVAYAENAMGGELSDDPKQIETLGMVFGAIQGEALSPQESVRMIQERLEGL